MTPTLLPCAEAARIAGVAEITMRRWMREGAVPGARLILARWYIDVRAFDLWLYGSNR